MADFARISRQFGISYFYYFLAFALGPLFIAVMTRTLSLQEYGAYAVLSATVGMFLFILLLGFSGYITTKLPGADHSKKIHSFTTIFLFDVVLVIILLAIGFIPVVQAKILALLKLTPYQAEFQLTLIILFFSVLYDLISSYLLANKRIEMSASTNFIFSSLWKILILIIAIFSSFSLHTVFSTWLIGVVIAVIIALIAIRKDILTIYNPFRGAPSILRTALAFSIPLVFVSLGSRIITLADRYMIQYFLGPESTAIYSVADSVVSMVMVLALIVVRVLSPYIAEAWNTNSEYTTLFNAAVKYSLIIIVPANIGVILLASPIMVLLGGTAYQGGALVIPILILYPLFTILSDIHVKVLGLRSQTTWMAIIFSLGAIVNVLLNLWLIPVWNLKGAAIATLVAYIVMFCFTFTIAKRAIKLSNSFIRTGRILLASCIMGVVIWFLNPQSHGVTIITILLGVLVYLGSLFVFRTFGTEEMKIVRSYYKSIQNVFK